MSPAGEAPVGTEGTAAFAVLADPTLFRDIVAWANGWPTLVVRRLREIKAALNVPTLPRSEFTWQLIWRSDLRALELTKCINEGQFVVEGIIPAIKAGDANAVRLAFKFSAPVSDWMRRRYWILALVEFPGHVDVLEALSEIVPLEETNGSLATQAFGDHLGYSRGGVLATPWGLDVGGVDSVNLVEWLVNKFGPERMPSSLLDAIAIRGKLDVVRYLSMVTAQQIKPQMFYRLYRASQRPRYPVQSPSQAQIDERASFRAVLEYLVRHRQEPHTRQLEVACVDAGDHEMLSLIQQARGLRFLQDVNIDTAASRGYLNVVQLVAANRPVVCTSAAMDAAAANGHLDVVKYLHSSGFATCTTAAMDSAAVHGHLDIVQFLHFNRTEGCTTDAIDMAASCGRLEIVKFLHENRSEGCTTRAMDSAARRRFFDVVQFLHENRHEGCTPGALVYPPKRFNGVLVGTENARSVLMYLLEHRTEPHPQSTEYEAMRLRDVEVLSLLQRTRGLRFQQEISLDDLAGEGNLPFLRFVAEHLTVTCTAKAMDSAAANGHIDVVRYLHETRTEGCTTAAMDAAAMAKHWDVVAFLDEHRREGCSYTVLKTAVRLGRLDLVQRYYHRFGRQDLVQACLVAGGYGFTPIQDFLRNVIASVASQE